MALGTLAIDHSRMRRNGVTGYRKAAILTPVLCAGMLSTALGYGSVLTHRDTIQGLQTLPLHSAVHLIGVVTYVDAPGRLFWIQDETGAMPDHGESGSGVSSRGHGGFGAGGQNGQSCAGARSGGAHDGQRRGGRLRRKGISAANRGSGTVAFCGRQRDSADRGHLRRGGAERFHRGAAEPGTMQIERRWPADLAMVQHGPVWTPPVIPAARSPLVFLMAFVFLLWVYILRRRVRQADGGAAEGLRDAQGDA